MVIELEIIRNRLINCPRLYAEEDEILIKQTAKQIIDTFQKLIDELNEELR